MAAYQAQLLEARMRALAQNPGGSFVSGGTSSQERDPRKEIILNFSGGEFGVANDAAANEIARKYNLDIVRRPQAGSVVPDYVFSVKNATKASDIINVISQIKNESGIRFAEQNFRQTQQPNPGSGKRILQQESDFYKNNLDQNIVNKAKQEYLASLPSNMGFAHALTPTRYGGTFGDRRGSGFDQWFTENYINKGLIQVPTSPRSQLISEQRDQLAAYHMKPVPFATPSNYDAMMAQQTYANLMRDQMAAHQAQMASASNSQFLPGVPPPPMPATPQPNQQAAANFANLTPQAPVQAIRQPQQTPGSQQAIGTQTQAPRRRQPSQGFGYGNPPISAF